MEEGQNKQVVTTMKKAVFINNYRGSIEDS